MAVPNATPGVYCTRLYIGLAQSSVVLVCEIWTNTIAFWGCISHGLLLNGDIRRSNGIYLGMFGERDRSTVGLPRSWAQTGQRIQP